MSAGVHGAADGVLPVLKPPGVTSHDVVAFARRLLGTKRVGHTGTLDPGAAGVLVLCVGRATRLVELLQADDKEYRAEMVLGVSTDSHDAFGKIVSTCPEGTVAREKLDEVVARFAGEIEQIPPMTSAIRHRGRHLYELARQGIEVPRPARRVRIGRLQVVRIEPDGPVLPAGTRVLLDIECSKGTYVRTLCHQLGQALGVGAYMSFLLRTRCGMFGLEAARTMEELAQDAERGVLRLVTKEHVLRHLPALKLSAAGQARARHGQAVGPEHLAGPMPPRAAQGLVGLWEPGETVIAVAEAAESGGRVRWQPRIVLV